MECGVADLRLTTCLNVVPEIASARGYEHEVTVKTDNNA